MTFFIKPATEDAPHQSSLYLAQHGAEPEPAYALRRPDRTLAASKNCYSIALFDSYNPDVLFAEILLRLRWTQPTLSAAEIRRNGDVASTPEPILPTEFVIQLYAPDQQVTVRQRQSSWSTSSHWEFELPQKTFREPSASSLDQSRHDPAVADTTSRLRFKWKREGKLSKDLVCTLSGRSTDPDGSRRKGSKEPDITVAFYKHLKAVTVYEPNLSRVEMEDLKGLEIVLLLSAVAIRDIFYGNPRDTFNISSAARQSQSNGRSSSQPASHSSKPALKVQTAQQAGTPTMPNRHGPSGRPHAHGAPPAALAPPNAPNQPDFETARIKAEVEAEDRARRKAEREETRRVKKMVEVEEREARRKQEQIDRETERLKQVYAAEQKAAAKRQRPPPPPQIPYRPAASQQNLLVPFVQDPHQRPQSAPIQQGFFSGLFNHNSHQNQPHQQRPPYFQNNHQQRPQPQQQQAPPPRGPYMHQPFHSAGPSSSGFFGSQPAFHRPGPGPPSGQGHSGRRSHSSDPRKKMAKKKSSFF
ncbi:MAG: hypothetical protein M1825_000546 [Sarcosagium campestre]|nr:MAG: hypothetical protein M1825_000546 [Sarcosagium campestre]